METHMNRSSRLLLLAAIAVASLTLTACATMNVDAYVARGVNFTGYRTYSWGPADVTPTGDPRLDNNPFFHERVYAAVEKRLADKHFEKLTSGTADLLIHFHPNMTQRIEASALDRDYDYCSTGDCRPYVYEAGTFVLDFVDTRTNRVIWRGWAERSMDGVVEDQGWMEETVDEAVARILDKLPPGL
jgi:hypothetical protein